MSEPIRPTPLTVVAGLSLRNLHPKVWDSASRFYLPSLQAVMVSYADFESMPGLRAKAVSVGIHAALEIPKSVRVYLDNGSFYFHSRGGVTSHERYEEFVAAARPDWWPIPQDFIPTPRMRSRTQERCLVQTMAVNIKYEHDGFVPVIHISKVLDKYVDQFKQHATLRAKSRLALGGIVPNLLRASKAIPYRDVLKSLTVVRAGFNDKSLHVFGIGGTATLHLAALLRVDSVDSSGWRNRAARGLIQLPGTGDRMVAPLGKWRGRELSTVELRRLRQCECPSCLASGLRNLRASGLRGFTARATHNLWVLLNEASWLAKKFAAKSYSHCYKRRLDNSIYLPLIEILLASSHRGNDGSHGPARGPQATSDAQPG